MHIKLRTTGKEILIQTKILNDRTINPRLAKIVQTPLQISKTTNYQLESAVPYIITLVHYPIIMSISLQKYEIIVSEGMSTDNL